MNDIRIWEMYAQLERARAQRDALRTELEVARRERDEARAETKKNLAREDRITHARVQRDEVKARYEEVKAELAVSQNRTQWIITERNVAESARDELRSLLVRRTRERDEARKERDEARANMGLDWPGAGSSNPQYDRSADAAGLLGWEGRDLHSKTIGTIQKARVTYSDRGFGAVEVFFATTWHRVNDCTVRKP